MRTAEIASPGIVVRVALNQRYRTKLLVNRTQNGQQDGMVSANAERACPRAENVIQLAGDSFEGVIQRKRIDREIAIVPDPPL
jgi:hypothetical protein